MNSFSLFYNYNRNDFTRMKLGVKKLIKINGLYEFIEVKDLSD